MSEPATDLKELLIERGFDWAIRMSQPPELAESVYVARLDALSALMCERGIGESRPSSEIVLV